MRVLIVGTGALGAYYGGMLAHHGVDVTFMARGDRLRALREHGLTVKTPKETFTLPVKTTDQPTDPADLALFCVKTYDTETAARLMLRALHEQSVVLPVQNGLTTTQTLASIIGRPCVLEGLARISAVMIDLNAVEHLTQGARIELGEPLQAPTGRAEAVAHFLCEHGVDALIPPDIQLSVWLKFLDVTSIGVGNVLTRLPLGEVMAVPESRAIVHQSLSEIVAVGRAYGVNFAPDAVERSMDYISRLPGHIKTSLLVDLEHGRRLEVEALSGAVVRLGEAKGIPTPLHRIVLGALLPNHLRALRA